MSQAQARPLLKYSLVIDHCMKSWDTEQTDRAFGEFCALAFPGANALDSLNPEAAASLRPLFYEWLVFDRESDDGTTFLQRYLAAPPSGIAEKVLDEFKQSNATEFTSLFWVLEVDATAELLDLEDAATGERFLATDAALSAQLPESCGLLGVRLVQIDGTWYLPGSPVACLAVKPTEGMRQTMRDSMDGKRPSFVELVGMAFQSASQHEDLLDTLELRGKSVEECAEILTELERDYRALCEEHGLPVSWEELVRAVRTADESSVPDDSLRRLFASDGVEAVFETTDVLMKVTSIFFNAWALLPHDALEGKSPLEVAEGR